MPKNVLDLEENVLCVPLQSSSQEFLEVRAKFASTSRRRIHFENIVKIVRIQNPQLYKSYLAKKESMGKTAGEANVNELELFHGTSQSSLAEINKNGFNRSFAGVNGKLYMSPVYFKLITVL